MRDLTQINLLPYIPRACRESFRFDPVTATVLTIAAFSAAGASAYSANRQASSAKAAAAAQERVGMKQIEASLEAPRLAAEAAKAKLKAKQASNTQSILTTPGGMDSAANTNMPSILGVG